MAGVKDEAAYTLANELSIEMGRYFQIQDDYLDCYGAPEVRSMLLNGSFGVCDCL